MKKRNIAYIGGLRIREAEGGGESRTIEGNALLFGVRSRLLCDWTELYYEVLEPGSVTKEMLDRQDIKLTMFHDRQLILARSNQGRGTLHYEVDEEGVRFWAEMPRTADGDKALELIARGDINGCSFIYSTDEREDSGAVKYEYITDEDGSECLLRHVLRILPMSRPASPDVRLRTAGFPEGNPPPMRMRLRRRPRKSQEAHRRKTPKRKRTVRTPQRTHRTRTGQRTERRPPRARTALRIAVRR